LYDNQWDESLRSLARLRGNHLGLVVCVATLDPVPFNELSFRLDF
jgi:hypothetical protein